MGPQEVGSWLEEVERAGTGFFVLATISGSGVSCLGGLAGATSSTTAKSFVADKECEDADSWEHHFL